MGDRRSGRGSALWRRAGLRVGLPLALSSLVLSIGHIFPFGTLANLLLAVAVWQFLADERQRSPPAAPAPVPA